MNDESLLDEVAELRARLRELEAELLLRGLAGEPPPSDRYRSLFENSADAILIIEGDTFVDCNRATVEMLRCKTRDELLRTHPSDLSPPFQPDGRASFEKANEMIAIAFREGSHRFEWDHKRMDGEVFPVEVLLTAMPEEGTTRLHVVWRDITERKQLETQLRQSQKMEAIGKLTGGIAHDFNNLLMVINGNAELLHEDLGDDAEFIEIVRQIEWAGARAAELTRQLLAFSRKQVLRPSVLDLNVVTTGVESLLSRIVGEDIRLVAHTSPAPLKFKADPGLIEQVIINLAMNARDAMPFGGTLTLLAAPREIGAGESQEGLDLQPGSYALLSVADTGAGMSKAIMGRAFEPFFTTKAMGEGTGLGLSTVHGIVRQSGGDIRILSELGRGTRVEAWFPISGDEISRQEESSEPVVGGSETILLVEDEESVATLVERILGDAGYTVLVCQDGRAALKLCETEAENIDLVLSDVVMPHMGGPAMAQALHDRGLDPIVIFASGYTNDSLGALEDLEFDAEFLQKPYSRRQLLSCVRAALDGRSGRRP